MARSRNIKPGFFTNAELASCSPMARLLFAGLWTLADKAGRLRDRPKQIKGELFPYDDVDVDTLLNELVSVDEPFINRYESQGVSYIQVVNWDKHQSPHHTEKESSIPPLSNGYVTVSERRELNQESGINEEGIRNQESGIRSKKQTHDPSKFDEWWEHVHSKNGKRAAESAYAAAVKRLKFEKPNINPHEYLIDRMEIYKHSKRNQRTDISPMQPSTWLNQGHYDDDPRIWDMVPKNVDGKDPRGNLAVLAEVERQMETGEWQP